MAEDVFRTLVERRHRVYDALPSVSEQGGRILVFSYASAFTAPLELTTPSKQLLQVTYSTS